MKHHLGPRLRAVNNIVMRKGTHSAKRMAVMHTQDHTLDEPTPDPTGAIGHAVPAPNDPDAQNIHIHIYQPDARALDEGDSDMDGY